MMIASLAPSNQSAVFFGVALRSRWRLALDTFHAFTGVPTGTTTWPRDVATLRGAVLGALCRGGGEGKLEILRSPVEVGSLSCYLQGFIPIFTPTKINIEPKNDGLEDEFPFHFGVYSQVNHVNLPWCTGCFFAIENKLKFYTLKKG